MSRSLHGLQTISQHTFEVVLGGLVSFATSVVDASEPLETIHLVREAPEKLAADLLGVVEVARADEVPDAVGERAELVYLGFELLDRYRLVDEPRTLTAGSLVKTEAASLVLLAAATGAGRIPADLGRAGWLGCLRVALSQRRGDRTSWRDAEGTA